MYKIKAKNKGIGLLELMLSLAIIAILLIMAVRYYQSANTSQQISSAADMFNAVRSAMKNYFNDNAGNSMNTDKVDNVSVSSLMSAGYLPPSFGTNPWNGVIGLSASGGAACTTATPVPVGTVSTYNVCMTQVPANACAQLTIKLQTTMDQNLDEGASCTGTTMVATYKYG